VRTLWGYPVRLKEVDAESGLVLQDGEMGS
jgi:hypothetical protein